MTDKELTINLLHGRSPAELAEETDMSEEAIRDFYRRRGLAKRRKAVKHATVESCARMLAGIVAAAVSDPLQFNRHTVKTTLGSRDEKEEVLSEVTLNTLNTDHLKEVVSALKTLSEISGGEETNELRVVLDKAIEALAK